MADERKKALVAELESHRPQVFDGLESVKRELSPSLQLKKSVRKHPIRWMAGSAGIAFLAMRLLRSKKVIYNDRSKRRGLIMRTGKLAFTLARPALTTYALRQAQEYAEMKLSQNPDNSMLGGPPQK